MTIIQDRTDTELRTWSFVTDARARFPTGTGVKARLWWGALLGDYAAGIYQTVNPVSRQAIRAFGLWGEVQQRLTPRWRVTAIYGLDDPKDADLRPGDRYRNQAGFLNVFWDASRTVGFGSEASRWETSYGAAGTTEVWRGDLLFFLRF